jgi:hypothetical protein
LFLFIKNFLFFFLARGFSQNFRFFNIKFLLFLFKRFLLENFGYSVNLANIIDLVLTNILGVSSILNITRSNILLLIFFITNTRGYVSFISFSYYITKGNRITIVMFG